MLDLFRLTAGAAVAVLAVLLALAAIQEWKRQRLMTAYGSPNPYGLFLVLCIVSAAALLGAAWLLRIV